MSSLTITPGPQRTAPDPTSNLEIANKEYVDSHGGGSSGGFSVGSTGLAAAMSSPYDIDTASAGVAVDCGGGDVQINLPQWSTVIGKSYAIALVGTGHNLTLHAYTGDYVIAGNTGGGGNPDLILDSNFFQQNTVFLIWASAPSATTGGENLWTFVTISNLFGGVGWPGLTLLNGFSTPTGTYDLSLSNSGMIWDCTGSDGECDLPHTTSLYLPNGVGGLSYGIVLGKTGSGHTLTIHPYSGQKINGSTSDVILSAAGQSLILTVVGDGWQILASNGIGAGSGSVNSGSPTSDSTSSTMVANIASCVTDPLVTAGGTVIVEFCPLPVTTGSASSAYFTAEASYTAGAAVGYIGIQAIGTPDPGGLTAWNSIGTGVSDLIVGTFAVTQPASAFKAIFDDLPAGTYTFQGVWQASSGTTLGAYYVRLVAYEI